MQGELAPMGLATRGVALLEEKLLQALPAGTTATDITDFFGRHRDSLAKALAGLIQKQLARLRSDAAPEADHSGLQALYVAIQDRPGARELARQLDLAIKRVRPDAWLGHGPKERVIKRAMYDVLKNEDEVEQLFLIVRMQPEYTKTEDQQPSDDDISERRVAELASTASSRLNNTLLPQEVMGKLILREIGSPFKRGLIPPTEAGFARFAELAYSNTTYDDWTLGAVVREWFRRKLPEEHSKIDDSEWDEVLHDATKRYLLKSQRGRTREPELALEMAIEWRLFRHRLLSAAGVKPPPAQRLPGHEHLDSLRALSQGELKTMLSDTSSFKVEVKVASEEGWSSNAQRHPTKEAAESAAKDLFSRWTSVKEWRVVPSDDLPNVQAKE